MKLLDIISLIEVLAGAIIIFISITVALRIRKDVSEDQRGNWMTTIAFMGFFVFGYLLFILVHLHRIRVSIEQISGIIFLSGAVFVYIVIKLSETTIHRISKQDREIQEYAQGLREKSVSLEMEIKERAEAEARAVQHMQNLSALHTIDMSISSSLALDVTIRIFLEQTVERLRVDAACVLLLDHHTQILKYFAGTGFHKDAIQKTSVRVGESAVGLAALDRRVVTIEDLGKESERLARPALIKEEGFASYIAVPLIAKAEVKGVLEVFHRDSLSPDTEWMVFLNSLALQAAIAIDNATLYDNLQRSNVELLIAYDSTLEGWARALEFRDKETEGHTRRVVEKTLQIAEQMGMSKEELVHVRRGALLHDIGKMSLPDSILMNTGPLTDEEMDAMKSHAIKAFELLFPIVYLRQALDIPYCHHERWDGTGYPRGLRGEQIPLAARIFMVVDTWDALRHDRRYHSGWSREKTCKHILSLSGTQFDPAVVKVFMDLECEGSSQDVDEMKDA